MCWRSRKSKQSRKNNSRAFSRRIISRSIFLSWKYRSWPMTIYWSSRTMKSPKSDHAWCSPLLVFEELPRSFATPYFLYFSRSRKNIHIENLYTTKKQKAEERNLSSKNRNKKARPLRVLEGFVSRKIRRFSIPKCIFTILRDSTDPIWKQQRLHRKLSTKIDPELPEIDGVAWMPEGYPHQWYSTIYGLFPLSSTISRVSVRTDFKN